MVSSVRPVPCSMQSMPALIKPGSASSLKTCAVTRALALSVCRVDGGFEHVIGPQRGKIADLTVDPVTDQLDPAVTAAGLLGYRCRQLGFVFELDREAGDVTLGSGQVPSGADDAGQVFVVVKAAGVGRRAAVPQQQRADVTFGLGLSDRLVEFDVAVFPKPDMAVRVDQPGQDPAAVKDGVGSCHRFGANAAVDDPQLDRRLVGQAQTSHVQAHGAATGPDGVDPLHPAPPHSRSPLLLAWELQLGQVEVGQAGRQLVETFGHL